jgi:MFS family permease
MKPDEKQSKIFYGWYILAIGMLGAIMAAGTSQLFMSILLKPLTLEFGWSRSAATGAIATGTIMGGLLSYPFGKLADRYGPRALTTVGALLTAGTYIAMGIIANLWQFYVVIAIGRAVSINALSGTVPRTAVVNWFFRFRGRVLGLLTMASPLGSSLLVIIANLIMQKHGWRTVFMLFALAMILLQALPAAIVLRKRPEDLGLLPDGVQHMPTPSTSSTQTPAAEEFCWTLSEAIRTPALWLLVLVRADSIIEGTPVNKNEGLWMGAV